MFGKSPHKRRRGKEVETDINRYKHYNHWVNHPANEKAKKWFDRPAYSVPGKKEEKDENRI